MRKEGAKSYSGKITREFKNNNNNNNQIFFFKYIVT